MHSFNAGVVVFELDRWRSTKRLDSVARWISRNEASQGKVYKLGSNPPFVLAVGPDLARLDPRWNCMRGIHRQHAHNTRCWGGAFIRHYPGGAKPWDEVEVTRSIRRAGRRPGASRGGGLWDRVRGVNGGAPRRRRRGCRIISSRRRRGAAGRGASLPLEASPTGR